MRLSLPLLLTLAACASQPAENVAEPANQVAALPDEAKPNPSSPPEATPSPTPTEDNRSTARYRCMDGSRLVARFDPDNDRVTVSRGGKALATLRGQRVASGISYTAKGYELRGKGNDLTFTAPDQPPIACAAIR
jgi:phosphomannomutase